MGLREDITAEGIASSETVQLGEHLVTGNVMLPCGCHWPLERDCVLLIIAGGRHSLNTTKFGQRIDTMSLEGLDQLLNRLLNETVSFCVIDNRYLLHGVVNKERWISLEGEMAEGTKEKGGLRNGTRYALERLAPF